MSMSEKAVQFQLGLFSVILSVFLYFYGIPTWVDTPGEVPGILSPRLWVYIIAGVAFLTGIALLISSIWADSVKPDENVNRKIATTRMVVVALVTVFIVFGIPTIGMVWVAIIGNFIFTMLLGPRIAWSKFLSAALIPLFLYFFFSEIFGVTVPQGVIVSLP